MGRSKKFHLKFTEHDSLSGNRKKESNYYRRLVASKKITYLHSLIENIDQLAIVSSFITPEIKPGLIDRFLVLSHHFKKKPFIVLTKKDLVDDEIIDYYQAIYQDFYPVFVISNGKPLSTPEKSSAKESLAQGDFKKIRNLFKGHHTAIVGHSGVGKTSLLNVLDEEYDGMVNEVSGYTNRGRHTTTRIKKYDFSFGGSVYDMPGLKEVDYIDLQKNELKNYYPEFRSFENGCAYKNCLHIHEPNCQVKLAWQEEKIHPVRYQNYLNILDSLSH